MKLIIEFDPWSERADAVRAVAAFETLGLPVSAREVRPQIKQRATEDTPMRSVSFEPTKERVPAQQS